jgi:hypothetical protein
MQKLIERAIETLVPGYGDDYNKAAGMWQASLGERYRDGAAV